MTTSIPMILSWSIKMSRKRLDLANKRYGKLKVVKQSDAVDGRTTWLCDCDCGNQVIVKGVYLTTGETKSCGCLKGDQEQENLRQQYDNKRVDGVVKPLFKDKEPRKDSTTGFRGVTKYYTRSSNELRYKAWITVKGKRYFKYGFKTPDDAYYNGRLYLENKHLPKGGNQK
ncbi:hypothetical protein [Natribacillus halophilus]|uniref:AP2 domain-containing protein n=1 Tax=Natribacillus halophilus TaxID=549003 RepID=A0A1G8RRJ1_9BACI|nr:hypothetical protein [Natribacillus halophilus]SDJ19587.1 hypothetical protein SAMN04488123_1206 [Natribacillus halophilus]